MSGKSMIRLDHIYKKFYGKKEEVLAVRDVSMEIEKGEIFSEDNITTKRPGNGISPMLWDRVMGIEAKRKYEEDELIEL